jgi:sodium-independent sulfate anion transporter 11
MYLNFTANGKPVDATQELLAVGLCNIGNSLVQGFPGSGSLSRSAVNNSSGVRTPLGGLYTGMFSTVPGSHKVLQRELF